MVYCCLHWDIAKLVRQWILTPSLRRFESCYPSHIAASFSLPRFFKGCVKMVYGIKDKLYKGDQNCDITVEIISQNEFLERNKKHAYSRVITQNISAARYCKAELFKGCVIGTFFIPDKKDLLSKNKDINFYIEQKRIVFADDTNTVAKILEQMQKTHTWERASIAYFFFDFMQFLIFDDSLYLQSYEEMLSKIEENLINKIPKNFYNHIIRYRREMLIMSSYYEQLIDMCETLYDAENEVFSDNERELFILYSNRVSRLSSITRMLREYILQIREMYQSRVDEQQNKVITVLTLITAIFLPLTLIAGWYGMNFEYMPELHYKYGYAVICIISAVVVITEIIIFKIKKFF